MKVIEIKEIIKKYTYDELKELIIELYDLVPEEVRKAEEIDFLVMDPKRHYALGRLKTNHEVIEFNQLQSSVLQFIDYVYKNYYLVPNPYVTKKERSNWRFTVKDFILDLQKIHWNSKNAESAIDLLKDLYKILSQAMFYSYLPTTNPFDIIHIEQDELYLYILNITFMNGINELKINSLLDLYFKTKWEFVSRHFLKDFIKLIKTNDLKEKAINHLREVYKELNVYGPLQLEENVQFVFNYHINKSIRLSNIAEMIFQLYLSLHEVDYAIDYYLHNFTIKNDEISISFLLNLLHEEKLKNEWLRIYNYAIEKNISISETFQKTYLYILKNRLFPKDL